MVQEGRSFTFRKHMKTILWGGIGILYMCYLSIISSTVCFAEIFTYSNGGIASVGAAYPSTKKEDCYIMLGQEIAGAGADNSGAMNNRGSIIK